MTSTRLKLKQLRKIASDKKSSDKKKSSEKKSSSVAIVTNEPEESIEDQSSRLFSAVSTPKRSHRSSKKRSKPDSPTEDASASEAVEEPSFEEEEHSVPPMGDLEALALEPELLQHTTAW